MISAIIVAAGGSRRMGFDKLSVEILGQPLLVHTINAFEACPAVHEILVVTAPDRFALVQTAADRLQWRKLRPLLPGGKERQDSVRAGLRATAPSLPLIAVHDGARPLTTPALIEACADAALHHGAACAAAPVVDTLKRRDPATGSTIASVDRTELWGMQTPQIFQRQLLLDAYDRLGSRTVTDEASAVELAGFPVHLIGHSEWNLKVTYPRDIALVSCVLKNRPSPPNPPHPAP